MDNQIKGAGGPTPGNEGSGKASRRVLPDRRMTPFDWNTPVRIDGKAPIQRRSGVPRRVITDRRRAPEIPPLPGAAAQALVFPGQGSQAVGMGKDLAASFPIARQVFDEVDDAVGRHLFRVMCEGPEETLMLTENAQPALMAYSMALLRVLLAEGGLDLEDMCRYVAGHSLGEYTALAAAGSLTLSETARLLRIRGKAMSQAVPLGSGGMAAVMGLDFDAVRDAVRSARDGGVCTAANDNAPGQVVISGDFEAVERAVAACLRRGARRTAMLTVSGPFHSPLMGPAADKLADALSPLSLRPPAVPLISNVLAGEVTDPSAIRDLLVRNLTGTVRWRESVLYMTRKGVRTVFEVGCGRVLSGLAKRIDSTLSPVCVGTPQEVEALRPVLKRMGGGMTMKTRKGERAEEQRRHTSKLLLDDVIETVVAAKMKTESLQRGLRGVPESRLTERLEDIVTNLQSAIGTLQSVSQGLRPINLDPFGDIPPRDGDGTLKKPAGGSRA